MVPDPDGQGGGDPLAGARRCATGARWSCSRRRPAAPTRSASMPPTGIGIPIVGDPVYGAGKGPMLLHALSLRVERGGQAAGRGDRAAAADLRQRRASAMSDFDRIPEEALEEKFLAATGPGGQNVNKVATACQLRCDVFKLGLAPDVYARLKTLAGSRMTGAGEIVITARNYRTQEANREDARARLAELIAKAHVRPAKRVKTKAEPGRQGEAGRQQEAARRGQAGARKGELTRRADACTTSGSRRADKAELYRELIEAADALTAGEPDAIANMANVAALLWESAARPQLGRLLPQCRRRAGARAVPGPAGLHPHPVRQGRVRRGGGDARAAMRRRRPRLSRPYRLRRRLALGAGRADRRRRRADRRARSRQPDARPASTRKTWPAVSNWHSVSRARLGGMAKRPPKA